MQKNKKYKVRKYSSSDIDRFLRLDDKETKYLSRKKLLSSK